MTEVSANTELSQELEKAVHAALETYSNVHRGSGFHSEVTTHLYEQAREIVLEYLGQDNRRYTVIFLSPAAAEALAAKLEPGSYQVVSSCDFGLSLGIRALAVKKSALPAGAPLQSGGGTARVVSREWAMWAGAPDRFEAGTPAVINVIALAVALSLSKKYGKEAFTGLPAGNASSFDIIYRDTVEHLSGRELLNELRQTMTGNGSVVATAVGPRRFVNLDNSASTPAFTPVWEAYRQALQLPGSVQHEIVGEVKSLCAGFLGAPPEKYEVIFTANATEAINLAAQNLAVAPGDGTEPVVLGSVLEHSSNDLPWRHAFGGKLVRLPADDAGFLDPGEMEKIVREYNAENRHGNRRIRLVTLSGASNVLGACNDLKALAEISHRYGVRLLVDAAQLVPHRRVDMEGWGIDYLAFSAHKMYAPFGCGALVAAKGLLHLSPAEANRVRLSGEENVAGIAALGKALVLLQRVGMVEVCQEEQALAARALNGLAQIPGVTLYGIKDVNDPRFSHRTGVIAFTVKGLMSDRVAKELALRCGIGIRYGCHCAHLLVKQLVHFPPRFERLQSIILTLFPKLQLPGVARASLGIGNTEADVDELIRAVAAIAAKPRIKSGLPDREVQRQVNETVEAAVAKVYGLPAIAQAALGGA